VSVPLPDWRTLQRTAGPMLPDSWKKGIGRGLGELTSARVQRQLARLAQEDGPVVAGPWLGEVGFELLYWIPFLAWFAGEFGVSRERLVVLSRGGTRQWYSHISANYHDVFHQVEPAEFRAGNEQRAAELGEQKQVAMTAFDRRLLAPVLAKTGGGESRVLHPSVMFRLFRPYWWAHASSAWVWRHARYVALTSLGRDDVLSRLPAEYVAVKFYYNDAFPATAANRAFARDVLCALRERGPVVSLSTGLAIDDHEGWEEEESLAAHGIRADLDPANNLALQTLIVAHARSWVGTYGGFAYLAPFHRIRATAYYSVEGGFSSRHLALATEVFSRMSHQPLLSVCEAGDVRAGAVSTS
jgi:hypothetical protein